VDGFLVVVGAHKTPRRLVQDALKTLEPSAVIGLIFNADDRPISGYYDGRGRPAGADRGGWWWGNGHRRFRRSGERTR
jgi:hypothetical protein